MILYRSVYFIACLLIMCSFGAADSFGGTATIAVTPFEIKAREDLPFLRDGIRQMLDSRLSISGVSSPVFVSGDQIPAEAEYILTGDILIFGSNTSTDAKLKESETGKVVLTFHKSGEDKGSVLSHINLLTERIKRDVFHLAVSSDTGESVSSGNRAREAPRRDVRVWTGPRFDREIVSLCVGDTNGDKDKETVLCTDNAIEIYKKEGTSKFTRLHRVESNTSRRLISVDTADMNGNRRSEIYVTAVHGKTLKPRSFILEYSPGSGYSKISDNLGWLFRTTTSEGKSDRLFGQKVAGGEDVLASGIYGLEVDASGMVTGEPLGLPEGISLYSFAYGDVRGTGENALVALSRKGTLKVYSADGGLLWKSVGSEYGGSNQFLEYKGIRYTREDGFKKSRYFLQQRVFVADVDNDGRNSVVVANNRDSANSFLARTRIYKKGEIVSLKWDRSQLVRDRKTRPVSGYIADFDIADYDSDGREEIVYSVSTSGGVLDTKDGSRIFSIDGFEQASSADYF